MNQAKRGGDKAEWVVRGTIVGDKHVSDIRIVSGKVVAVGKALRTRKPDAGSDRAIIGPTLFDIQVNGGGGINLQGPDVQPEDVAELDQWMRRHGVSHWIPTFITESLKDMERGCRVIAEALQDKGLARRIPGVHLEGPYISPVDGPRGAHTREHVRKPDIKEFDRLVKAADGKVAYTTVAPEIEGAIPYIKAVARQEILVSLGHHQADAETIRKAVDAGARLCTHLGNGLSPAINRHHNPLWPQLADDRLHASLIADLHHLPAEALKTFVRVKGADRIVLTSDCVHIAGLAPGEYELAGSPVELTREGRINLKGTSLLAGSGLMLLQGVLNVSRHTDFSLAQSFAAASDVPCRLFGQRYRFFSCAIGKRANFTLFDEKLGKVTPLAVLVDGVRAL